MGKTFQLQTSVALALAAGFATGFVPGLGGRDALAAPTADRAFTVGNYPVSARAQDAVTAKENAHADGQQAAFRSLLKRLVPVTAYRRLPDLRTIKSSDFIDGVSIRSERNSRTEYIASLDFSFQANAVRDLLTREGIPFVDSQAQPIVVVPVEREGAGAQATYKVASRGWSDVWNGLDLEYSLAPLKPQALAPSLAPDTIGKVLAGDTGADRALTTEYKVDNVIVAIAEVDRAGRRLSVTLVGHDAVGPINWTRSYRIKDGDVGYAMELAAVISQGVLEGRWKAERAPDAVGVGTAAFGDRGTPAPGVGGMAAPGGGTMAAAGGGGATNGSAGTIAIQVEFYSPEEWGQIRRQVLEMPGVDDVEIENVSSYGAQISLSYPGGGARLAQALSGQGLALERSGASWVLRER